MVAGDMNIASLKRHLHLTIAHYINNYLVLLFQITAGSGILSIKFIKYNNSEGNTRDGKICDPVLQNCDYYFTLCVDHLEEQVPHCKLGRKKITGVTLQSNNIVFQDKIGRTKTPNPMEFYFKRWLVSRCL